VANTAYIDLSAKVEQWTQASAIAIANDDQCRVYMVPSKVKQQARQLIKQLHGSTSVQYRLLAVLVYLVARESLASLDYLVIDRDYAGDKAEGTIKNLLLDLIHRDKLTATASMIRFDNVKGSRADKLAKQVYDRKIKADREVKWRGVQIIEEIKKLGKPTRSLNVTRSGLRLLPSNSGHSLPYDHPSIHTTIS
jgi:hypothetical protein